MIIHTSIHPYMELLEIPFTPREHQQNDMDNEIIFSTDVKGISLFPLHKSGGKFHFTSLIHSHIGQLIHLNPF